MKSILFLGGGPLGIPIIKWAKEIGFNVIVNDKNPSAPGFTLANEKIHFDSTDIRSLSTWALSNKAFMNICYCYCGSDFGLLTAAFIHEVLSIPHTSLASIINGLDKSLMKKCWNEVEGINYPASIVIKTEHDIYEAGKQLGWPLIIKPTSSSGSQGVSLAKNKDDAVFYFQEAEKYAEIGHVIAEQFLEGSHHDVNGLFWDDVFYPCGIGDRFFTPFPYCVPHHGYFPSTLVSAKRQELYGMLENGARAMGITRGPVKADGVVCNDKCYVYEISPRFHGDVFISNVMGFLKDVNPVYQFLNWIYRGKINNFKTIDENLDITGGWKTIFHDHEKDRLTNAIGLYVRDGKIAKTVRNNDEIVGLAWAWEKSREIINRVLEIEAYD